jgi:NTP pyrophosphatase (non-canonical NTP hydrolase)
MVEVRAKKAPMDLKATADSYSMDDWQEYFRNIFYEKNSEIKKIGYRNNKGVFTRGFLLSLLAEDLGALAEQIREGQKGDSERYVGSLFAWIFGLANEWEFSLQEALWTKYPGYCRTCGRDTDCIDAWWESEQMKKNKKPQEKTSDKSYDIPRNLSGWIEQWDRIYGAKIRVAMPISDIMHKLYEEYAEILQELDKITFEQTGAPKDLKIEVADFVSWIFGLIIKLTHYCILKSTLSDMLYAKFGKGCARCKEPKCKCFPKWINEKG